MDTTAAHRIAREFFDGYAAALLARDADAVAATYQVPGLILFPGQSLPVTSQEQTRLFFTGAFGQYQGIQAAETEIVILLATHHSIWSDVTWRYDTGASERLLYQLADSGLGWRIAVLTPLAD